MAGATFYVGSDAGLANLDEYLLSRSYITGYQASKDDLTVHAAFTKPPSSQYVNASRWYNHITDLLRTTSGVSAEGSGVAVEESASFPETNGHASETNGHDSVAETSAIDRLGEETEEVFNDQMDINRAGGKSSVLLDVKPWDDETDMQELEDSIRSVQMEGLHWGASKLAPVGYGMRKLQIMMTIVDDLVSVDTLIEEKFTVEPINEYVQSCDIVAFNKICKLLPLAKPMQCLSFDMCIF